jgi:hypothetical protein
MCCALIRSDIRFEFEIDHRLCLCHSEMDLSYLDNEKWHAFVRELLRNAAPSQLSIYNTFTEYQHFAQQYQLMQDERVCTFDTLTRSLVAAAAAAAADDDDDDDCRPVSFVAPIAVFCGSGINRPIIL